jgi:hypothetical protein
MESQMTSPAVRGRGRAAVAAGAVVSLVVTAAVTVVGPPAASAAVVDTSAWYELVARHSGKALEVSGAATGDGAPLVQWTRSGAAAQQWQFVDSGGGWYRLRARHSGRVVDVADQSTADGAPVVQWSDNNGANQQFRLVDSDAGHVRLINRNSGKALDVNGRATTDGARIIQWPDNSGTNQQWQLVRVGGPPPGSPPPTTPPPAGPYAGYLFSYFTGEGSATGERVHFALSDGDNPLRWRELNRGQPVLTSTVGTQGVRDPFIIRSPDGTRFYQIATDLRMYGSGDWDGAQRRGSRSLVVWESTDLVNWTDHRLVRVAPDTAGNVWAPEAFHDRSTGEFVVFWASKIYAANDPGHTGSTHNRMMYATTRDFRTFSAAREWFNPGYSVIDSTIVEHNGGYYRYTKDERGNSASAPCGKFIMADRSTSVLSTSYQPIATCIGRGAISQGEGPLVFRSNTEQRWYMFVDEFGGRGYVPFETTNLDSGQWTVSSGYALPASPRHGTVLPVTRAEYDRLLQRFG